MSGPKRDDDDPARPVRSSVEPDLASAKPPSPPLATRPPSLMDLMEIGRHFERHGVEYVLIGGMAMNYHGRTRGTEDIDFLVRVTEQNFERIREALSYLPDAASLQLDPKTSVDDLSGDYACVRIADEIIVDLIGRVGDLCFENAGFETKEYDGVLIRIADLKTMIRSKQGITRERDLLDRQYLEMLQGGGI